MRPINQSLDFQHNDIVNANIVNMIVEARPSDPTTATSGQIYYNSTMKMLRIFDGLVWRTLSSGTGVMSYKGVVTNWTDLPTTGMEKGDYWVNSTTQAARVWNGNTSSWDDIGNATFVVDTILSDTSTNAVENRVITRELLQRLKKLCNEPVSGQPYHFPFNINAIVQESDKISTTFDTLTLDGNNTKTTYPLVIPAADPTNDKAGLLTKALYDAKSAVSVSDTGTATEEVQYITIDGVEKKIAGGENVLVYVNAIMTDTQSFEGTVTQEQFDACREGGKILSITLSNALGEVVCKAVANEYVANSETGFHAMALITRDGVTGAVTIGEIKVSSDLILRGTLFSIGANVEWGSIGGTLGNQADLNAALGEKASAEALNNLQATVNTHAQSINDLNSGKQDKSSLDTDVGACGYLKDAVLKINMNGTVIEPTGGIADLGTVITEHQDITGKQNKVTYGTTDPEASAGVDGDVYIKYIA